ncbi:hypothetical protein EDB84DRAFT_700080 [Lactarius hengduanensis]|nr:hypothetical protein EDB84DRAFT_700080 [Lactarius hengduanensis]
MASAMPSHPKFPPSYIVVLSLLASNTPAQVAHRTSSHSQASGSPASAPRQATTLVLHTSHRLSSYLRRPSYRDSAVSPNLPRTSVASIRLSRPFRRAQVCDDPLWAAPHGPVIQRTSCSAPSSKRNLAVE